MSKIKITPSQDGSNTVYSHVYKEHYHSVYGAIAESKHIYIQSGIATIEKNNISVLEIGFGTGLNAILTQMYAEINRVKITYNTIEKHPIESEIYKNLNYCSILNTDKDKFIRLHTIPFDEYYNISEYFTFRKTEIDLLNYKPNFVYDLVFFDAFAPDIQPDLWTKKIFQTLYNNLSDNGILVTYSSKGIVKTALREVGFTVKRKAGPPPKRHILFAQKR